MSKEKDKKSEPEKLFLDVNRAKQIAPADAARMLYNHYPVPEGCPHCGALMFLTNSTQQLSGIENIQVSTCPGCNASLEFVIGKYLPSGKFKPADLRYLKPDGDVMKAYKTDLKILVVKQPNQN